MKEKEEVVNINFLKKVWYSITNFEQYPVMATEGLLRAIKYLTILTAIVTVFTMISSLLQMNKVIDNLAQYIEQNIPDFSITEGKVTMDLEQPIIIEKVKYTGIDKVVINPLAETDEQREQSEEAETVSGITVFFFSDKIVLISKIDEEQVNKQIYTYSEFVKNYTGKNIQTFNKAELIGYLTSSKMMQFYIRYGASMYIYLLLINIIPFMLFIYFGSKYYFEIISNSKESNTKKNKKEIEVFKKNSPVKALTIKELRRYFSSPVYMFNTMFGLLLLVSLTILLCIKGNSIIDMLLSSKGIEGDIDISLSLIYYILVLFSSSMTSISSSSISLEGKTINITKSLPISERDILRSKIIYPYIIELPFILLSELIFFVIFKVNIMDMLLIFCMGIILVTLTSIIGVIVNLKYPKMNASNDTEVVKQSMSSMISVFIGMGIFIISLILGVLLYNKIDMYLLLGLHIIVLLVVTIGLYMKLMNNGIKEYRNINV